MLEATDEADAEYRGPASEASGARETVFTVWLRSNCETDDIEDSIEEKEELRIQIDESQLKPGGTSQDGELCCWRVTAIEDITYSGWMVNRYSDDFSREELYIKSALEMGVLKKFIE